MKIKNIVLLSAALLMTGCCLSPIQGTNNFGSCSTCSSSSYTSCETSCTTSYSSYSSSCGSRNTTSFCGDSCNRNGCTSYFGNVGGLNYDDPGSM